jgi:hypothetical protein
VPETANLVNQVSATNLTDLRLTAEQRFIDDAAYMIGEAQQLGHFSVCLNVPCHVNIKNMYYYFSKLGYVLWPVYQLVNPYHYVTSLSGDFSGYPESFWPYVGPEYISYPQGITPYFPVQEISPSQPRVRLSWSTCPIYPNFWPPYSI